MRTRSAAGRVRRATGDDMVRASPSTPSGTSAVRLDHEFRGRPLLQPLLTTPAVPVAVAVGVLGYHLLEITVTVTVRRLLVYLPLVMTIALLTGALTTLIAWRTEGAEYGAWIAAVAIAVIVLPLRDALMRRVDRLLYGRARDPLAVVDQLGAADPGDPEALLAALAESIRSPGVALRDAQGGVPATVGTASERPVAIHWANPTDPILRMPAWNCWSAHAALNGHSTPATSGCSRPCPARQRHQSSMSTDHGSGRRSWPSERQAGDTGCGMLPVPLRGSWRAQSVGCWSSVTCGRPSGGAPATVVLSRHAGARGLLQNG